MVQKAKSIIHQLFCGVGAMNTFICASWMEKKDAGDLKCFMRDTVRYVTGLDPDRYYHISCPYEGKYANDPSFGIVMAAGHTVHIHSGEGLWSLFQKIFGFSSSI